jgi:hypothetical protein
MSAPNGIEVFGESLGRVPATMIAVQRVAEVRDSPQGRLELLRSSYAPLPGAAPMHLRYRRARPRSWPGSCDVGSSTRSIIRVRAARGGGR